MRARIFAEENKKWWTLAAVAFGLFMIMLDNTIVNVALPSIQKELKTSPENLEWTVNAYVVDAKPAAALHYSAVSPGPAAQPHENRMPVQALNFCISLLGLFPSRG